MNSRIARSIGTIAIAWTPVMAAPGYLDITEAEAETTYRQGQQTIKLEVEAAAPIPTDGQSGAFGYAALTSGGNNVLVLVTHLPIDDSSFEKVPSGFHAHVLDLKAPTPACPGATFEVDFEGSKQNKAFDANYRWKIEDRELEIERIPAADLGDAGIENLASFTLKPVLGADGKPTSLCVTVAKQI